MKHGWEIKKLGEVCKLTNGYAFQSKEYTDDGYFVIRIGNVQDGYIELNNPRYIKLSEEKQKKFILSEGDILVSLTGNVGRVGEIKEEHLPAVLNQRVAKISLNSKSLQKAYLFYFLTSEYFITELIKAGRGAAQQNISTTDIENLIIPLPPLPEQQRIVSILDEAFAAIAKAKANAEQNLRNAKELFESYLQGVFEKKGVGWDETHLSEVCDFENGDRGKNYPNKSHRVSSGIPFINAGHLNENRLDFSDMDYISEERFNMLGNGKIKPNDILFCLRGSLGKVANVGNLDKGAIASSLVILRVKNELDNDFLLYFLNSNLTKKQIVDFGNGAAQPNLSAASLKKFIIPFPKSKEEQQTIVRQLDALRAETQKLEVVYQKKMDDLEELKKSILQKAFAGELKTSQEVV